MGNKIVKIQRKSQQWNDSLADAHVVRMGRKKSRLQSEVLRAEMKSRRLDYQRTNTFRKKDKTK